MKTRFLVCIFALWATSAIAAQETILFTETFATDLGKFTLDEHPYPGCTYASVWRWSSHNGIGYAYINVNSGSTSRGASNCKLVSPIVDASEMKEVSLSFTHATFSGSSSDASYLSVEATTDGTNWSKLTIPTWSSSKWGWVTCNIKLSSYISTKMQFRFVYTSTDSYAPAWEIRDVTVTGIEKGGTEFEECRYISLEGLKDQALLNGLHNIIEDHTILSYDDVRADKAKVDLRSDGSVWDMYSDCSLRKTDYCGYGDDFPACDCYNREHMLPKSFWGGSTDEPMYTDLHHIIPTDFVANTNRSAWIYDEVSSTTWTNNVSKVGSSKNFNGETAFEPSDEYKGDIARVYFYMITCYNTKNFTQGGKGWKYFINGTAKLKSAAINLLLKWHRNDPVSQKEIDRNNAVENLQGNRNPFVDEPILAEHLWGDKKGIEYMCSSTSIKNIKPKIDITDDKCKVYSPMGVDVTNSKNNLPQGLYILYLNGHSTTIYKTNN